MIAAVGLASRSTLSRHWTDEGERSVIAVLPVLGEPATAVQPRNAALDDPASGFNDEAFG
jgi:hypothetical protein